MCEGCDTLCVKCESQVETCNKCNHPCHCAENDTFVKSCEDCGCVGCQHEET